MRPALARAVSVFLVFLPLAGTLHAAGACPSFFWTPGHQQIGTGWLRNLAPIDYDRDGKLDLAAIVDTDPDTLVTFRGVGNGTFESPVTLLTADSNISGAISDVEVGDVDSDGYPDLVVVYKDRIRVYRGTGSGLSAPVDQSLGYFWPRITMGNYDGDPALEIVAAAASYNMVVIYDNNAGTFVEQRRITGFAFWPLSVVSADFDGDGRFDVAAAHRRSEYTGTVDVYFKNGDGSYTTPLNLSAGSFPSKIVTADFNGDGRPDLAVSNWYDNSVTVYTYNGSRQFTSHTINVDYPEKIGDADHLIARDVTSDGAPDLLVSSVNGGWQTTLAGVGNGTFRSPSYIFIAEESWGKAFHAQALGDFDNDGDLDLAAGAGRDLVIAAPSCATQVTLTTEAQLISAGTDATLNVSISGFGPATPLPYGTVTLKKGATTIATADVNGNGKASLVAPSLTAGDHTFTAEFSGNGELAAATSNTATQRVTTATTQTVVTVSTTEPVFGDPLPVTVAVNNAGDQWFKLFVDGVPTMYHTSQTINLTLPAGQHSIYAKFYGSVLYPASTSETRTINVQKRTPGFVLQSGALTVRSGQSHTLVFAVNGPSGISQPAGTVQLFNGATLAGSAPVANNQATVSVTLPRGAHGIRAVYSGDGNYNTTQANVDLNVVADQPLAINARGLTSAVHIAYVVPDGTTSTALYRRTAGGAWGAIAWDGNTGLDADVQRGVVYEYQLRATVSGVEQFSNVDGAMLFTDDPVNTGDTVKRLHFSELRDAVNLLRANAGLAPFAFSSSFDESPISRAEHLTSLQTAAAQARAALGMSTLTFDSVSAGSVIRASQIREIRDAVR